MKNKSYYECHDNLPMNVKKSKISVVDIRTWWIYGDIYRIDFALGFSIINTSQENTCIKINIL